MTVSTTIAVELDGSGSSDADGDALTYSWSFAFVPSGSSVAFDDDTVAQPTFTPDLAGDYTIELVVFDGTAASNTDEVVVSAADSTVTQTIGAAGGTIVSDDGLLTLSIPPNALMSDEDISITSVAPDQWDDYLGPDIAAVKGTAAVYDLRPDGLSFAQPATASVVPTGNPVIDAQTLGGPLQFLYSLSGSVAAPLGDLTLTANANTASMMLSGNVDHFSGLWWTIPDESEALNWEISGVPDQLVEQDEVIVRPLIQSATLGLRNGDYYDFGTSPVFSRTDGSTQGLEMQQQPVSGDYALDVPYRCQQAGATEYKASVVAGVVGGGNPGELNWFVDTISLSVTAEKDVECVGGSPGPSARLPTGLAAAPAGLTGIETVQVGTLLSDMTIAGIASAATDPMLLLAGAEGSVLFNPSSGEVVRDSTDPNRINPRFGAVLASTTLPGGQVAGMIYEFGPGQLGANRRCDYDESIQDFSTFCEGRNGTGYDASPVGGSHTARQVAYVTSFEIGSLQTNIVTGDYEYVDLPVSFNDFFGSPFSALRTVDDGPMLVVTNNAPDFSTLARADTDGTVTLIETFFGEDHRKIRCVLSLCGTSVYDDGNGNGGLRLAIWDGVNAPTLINSTIPVGDGPVDVAPLDLGNGNALFGTTGFDDSTITLTQSTLSGDLVSNNTAPAPGGCQNPAHLAWYVPDGAEPSQAQLVGTCFGSNQYFIVDIILDPTLGYIFIDPTTPE